MIRFRVLGTFEVLDDAGDDVELGPPQQRALLALLALRAPTTTAVDEIIDALWSTDPPSTARNLVQVYVSRLRKALRGVSGAELVTRPPGYALELDPADIDAHRFEQAAAEAMEESAPAARAERLGDALSLWRGRALADLSRFEFLAPDVTRLEDVRLAAVEAGFEARVATGGRDPELLGDLERFVDAHPLREQAWVLYLIALYERGRQADALRAYERVRRILLDELGVDPIPELQELQRAILVHDRALLRSGPSASPEAAVAPTDAAGLGAALGAVPAAILDVRPGAGSFRGRDDELRRLLDAFDEVSVGGVRVVLVAGDAGIGKSRLVTEASRAMADTGALVLAGTSRDGLAAPFEPVVLALRRLVDHLDVAHARAIAGAVADELVRLIPTLSEGARPAPPTDADAERFALLEAADEFLAELGRHRPVVLVLDDLHWVDAPTVLLLRHLRASTRAHRLLVVGTYRLDMVTSDHAVQPLLGDVRRHGNGRLLTLDGLEPEAHAELVAELAGGPDLVDTRALWHRTGGNPLFTEYLLDQPQGPDALPMGVVDLIDERLARVRPGVVDVLQVAAVVGERFEPDVVAAVARSDRVSVLASLDEAIQEHCVVEHGETGQYAFRHALTREALVARLTAPRRVILHWRIGEALVALAESADRAELRGDAARHLVAGAAAGDPARAIDVALSAADAALASLAYETAVGHLAEARDLVGRHGTDDERRWEVESRVGRAAQTVGDEAQWRRAYAAAFELARRNGWEDRLVEAVLGFAYLPRLVPGDVDTELLALVDAALDVAARGSLEHFRLVTIRTHQLLCGGELAAADTLLARALRDARSSGDDLAVIGPLQAQTYRLLGLPDAETMIDSAIETLSAAGDHSLHVRLRALVALAVGRLQTGDRVAFDRVHGQLREVGRPKGSFEALLWDGSLATAEGRLADAEVAVDAAGRARPGDAGATVAIGVQASLALPLARGDIGTAATAVEAFRTMMPELPVAQALAMSMAWLQGDDDQARRLLDHLLSAEADRLPRDWTRPMTLRLVAEVAGGLGVAGTAALVAEHLRAYSGQVLVTGDGAGIEGAADGYLAEMDAVAGLDDAVAARFVEAIRLEDRLGFMALSTRTRLAYARALLVDATAGRGTRSEHRSRAAELLDTASAAASRLGLVRLGRRAADVAAGDLSAR